MTLIFAVVCALIGGFAAAVLALWTMMWLDWPLAINCLSLRERERQRKRVFWWVCAAAGAVIFLLLLTRGAWAIVDVDVDAAGAAKEVGSWDYGHVAIIMVGLVVMMLIWKVGEVAKHRNQLEFDRRNKNAPAPENCGGQSGNGGARDVLWQQITEIRDKMADLVSKDDLRELKADLMKALNDHDKSNAEDFKDLAARMKALEDQRPGDSNR